MWYVIQVRAGAEENIRQQCEKRIESSVMERCFIPCYEEQRHIQGKWMNQKRVLFPGYVFAVTDQPEELFLRLKKVIGLTKLLGVGDTIVPLTEEEIEFLLAFGGKEQIVEMSCGVIEGDRVKVLSGPLCGKEGLIRKIDRHKRKAYLDVEMFGRV